MFSKRACAKTRAQYEVFYNPTRAGKKYRGQIAPRGMTPTDRRDPDCGENIAWPAHRRAFHRQLLGDG